MKESAVTKSHRGRSRAGIFVYSRSALVLLLIWVIAPARVSTAQPFSPAASPTTNSFTYEIRSSQGVPLWNFGGAHCLPFYNTLRFEHRGNGLIRAFSPADTNNAVLTGRVGGVSSRPWMRLRSTAAFPEVAWDPTNYTTLFGMMDRRDRFTVALDPSSRLVSGFDQISRSWTEWMLYDPNNAFNVGNHVKWVTYTKVSRQPVTWNLPETTDGSWTLLLNVVSEETRIYGSALIALSNTESFEFKVKGRLYTRSQIVMLYLTGLGEDKGATLTLALAAHDMSIQRMRGRIGGQALAWVAPRPGAGS